MARKMEDQLLSAIQKSFKVSKVQQNNATKSFIAICNIIPVIGERLICKRIEKSATNEIFFQETRTSTVQRIKRLSHDVFVATTRNSNYIVKVLSIPESNVHFAIPKHVPKIGEHLHCFKMSFTKNCIKFNDWETSTVFKVELIQGLYRVETRNSIYICFPVM